MMVILVILYIVCALTTCIGWYKILKSVHGEVGALIPMFIVGLAPVANIISAFMIGLICFFTFTSIGKRILEIGDRRL